MLQKIFQAAIVEIHAKKYRFFQKNFLLSKNETS